MKNFIFKSSATDLQKMFSILDTLQKNTLYLTYRIDSILKKINTLEVDKGVVKQTLDYYQRVDPHPEVPDEEDV